MDNGVQTCLLSDLSAIINIFHLNTKQIASYNYENNEINYYVACYDNGSSYVSHVLR